MMIKHLRNSLLGLVAVLGLSVFGSVLFAHPVAAANETYTWKDYRTITVSGGDTVGSADFTLNPNVQLNGDMTGAFTGQIQRRAENCIISFTIYIYNTTNQIYTWAPAGILPVPPSVGLPGSLPSCNSKYGNYDLQLTYSDHWFTPQGTRPGDPNAPEKPSEKMFRVLVLAPDPQSRAPATDTVKIYSADGRTLITQQTVAFQSDNGMATRPPSETPVSANVILSLDPGNYIVCDTYVARSCAPPQAAASQRFTKVKYDGTGSITIGTQFLTADKRVIVAHVNYHVQAPCGSAVTVNPVQVTLTGPNGQTYNQMTGGYTIQPSANESGALCQKNVMTELIATFENMPAGSYTANTAGAVSVNFTKPADAAGSVTLEVTGEPLAPQDEPNCTAAQGAVAGGLAWVICPFTQMAAGLVNFLETNIIEPFMTISPLTASDQNPLYVLWQAMRNIADVGAVAMLLAAVLLVAFGKYGAKRVVQRIVLVVVLINLSYFAVALAVDLFNLLGAGLNQLVLAALRQAGTTQLNSGTSAGSVRSIFTVGGAALLTIIATGGSALGWLFSFIGIATLIVVALVFALIIRVLGIDALAVISPLAALMLLLPNTEQLGKKGFTWLIKLLALYPAFLLPFAGGKVLSYMLSQPGVIVFGNDISGPTAEALRVILQFAANVIPLLLIWPLVMGSNALMRKASSWANNSKVRGFAKGGGKAFNEGVVNPRKQELKSTLAERGGAVGWVAGYGARQQFKREQREREIGRARQEYLANEVLREGSGLAGTAAGMGGERGVLRVQAAAVSQLESQRREERANEKALFENELRKAGISTKEFNIGLDNFLKNPNDSVIQGTVMGADGTPVKIDLAQRQDLLRSGLDAAAAAGEINTMERARLSSRIDQSMVDEVIRNNASTLIDKGGWHLATNFNLAHGRSGGTERDINIARLRESFGAAGSDIAGMKASFVNSVRQSLQDPTTRAAMFTGPDALTADERKSVKDNIRTILAAPDIGGAAKNIDALRQIEGLL